MPYSKDFSFLTWDDQVITKHDVKHLFYRSQRGVAAALLGVVKFTSEMIKVRLRIGFGRNFSLVMATGSKPDFLMTLWPDFMWIFVTLCTDTIRIRSFFAFSIKY